MKNFILCLSVCAATFLSCTKDRTKRNFESVIQIVETTTPKTISKGNAITSRVVAEASNLCYSFSRFDVKASSDKVFDVRAIAKHPDFSSGTVCAMAIYRVDTLLQIPAPTSGTYVLKFYSRQQLFKTDTVVVN